MGAPCSKQQQKKKVNQQINDGNDQNFQVQQRMNRETLAYNNQQNQLEQEDNQQLDESVENISKKQSLIDVAEDSIKIAKKRNDSFEKQSKLVLSSNRKDRYTVQVIDSVFDKQSHLRQRIIQSFQQKQTEQLILENDDSQPVAIFSPRSTQKKSQISENYVSLLNQNVSQFYFKIVSDIQIYQEQQEQLKDKVRNSNELLLSKIQITDNYLNNYGFFNILREGFKKIGTNLILIPKVPMVDSFIQNINFFSGNHSYYYYQLSFQIKGSFNYDNIKQSKNIYLQPLEKIIRIILNQEKINTQIIWLLCRNVKQKQIEILFTLPSLQENKKELLKQKFIFALKSEYKNFSDVKIEPLFKYLEVSFDLLDPWKCYQKQGWKHFGLKFDSNQINNQNIQNGFMNLFFQSPNSRQHDSEPGMFIAKSLQQFDMDLIPEFMRPKEIQIKVYGEEQTYQVILNIQYDITQAKQIFQGVYLLPNQLIQIYHTQQQVEINAILIRQL